MKKVLLIFIMLCTASFVNAQHGKERHNSGVEFSAGIDIVSSFVWRGLNLGNSPAIQPRAALGISELEIGLLGSYALMANASNGSHNVPYAEFDIELKYSIPTKIGTFSITCTDIFLPHLGLEYFNYDGVVDGEETGAHCLAVGFEYEGPRRFPIYFKADYNFHNEVSKSIYGEFGLYYICGRTNIKLFCGVALATNNEKHGSIFYELEEKDFGIINLGATINRQIEVSDSFIIPLSTSVIINPTHEAVYLVGSLSL